VDGLTNAPALWICEDSPIMMNRHRSVDGDWAAAAVQQGKVNHMRYLLAIVLPPLAVLLCGKPIQALLNLVLTLLGCLPGMVHAILVVNGHLADKRTDRLIRELRR
jgi:uncharacterized membrane protein YqaE (UPF0057 family)